MLTQAELRAVLAHELAHLARGDATRAARSARFVEGLELAVEQAGRPGWGPLGAWARFCLREASWLIEPVARSQEARADRMAAIIAGGGAAASALVKVALVQPLFREVLEHYDPNHPEYPNLYAFFRTFWYRLSGRITLDHAIARADQPARHPRPRSPPPARPPRLAPGVSRPGLRQRRRLARHHVPGRPRDLRADAPQPALRLPGSSRPSFTADRVLDPSVQESHVATTRVAISSHTHLR